MANLFARLSEIVSANLNDLLDRVEDPERMIKQIIREMEENLNSAKEGVVDALASEKQLKKELDAHRRQVQEWHARAEKALASDNETLAREALARKKEHERIGQSLESSWEAARNTTTRLKSQLQALEAKLEEARRKKTSLIARQRAAEAREQMDKTLSNVDKARHMQASFGRMEDKITEMEARVEAHDEIYSEASQVEREFLAMEVDAEVEAELEGLKQKLGKTGTG